MKFTKNITLLLSILLTTVLQSTASQLASAKLTAIEGNVTKTSDDGEVVALKVGDILVESDTVSVPFAGKAELVFSNGSELSLMSNSSLSLTQLEQEPFGGTQSYDQLEADPSKSQTLLELNYGKLVGHVKKLAKGSNFEVETPMGTASIRGTIFTVELLFDRSSGQFVLNITNTVGQVNFISKPNIGCKQQGKQKSGAETEEGENEEGESADAESQPVTPGNTISLVIGSSSPVFDVLMNVYSEVIESADPSETIIPLITPEDDGDDEVIVVSPEGPSAQDEDEDMPI